MPSSKFLCVTDVVCKYALILASSVLFLPFLVYEPVAGQAPSEKPNRQQQTPGVHVYGNARTLDSNSLTQPIGSDASEQPSLGVQPLAGTK